MKRFDIINNWVLAWKYTQFTHTGQKNMYFINTLWKNKDEFKNIVETFLKKKKIFWKMKLISEEDNNKLFWFHTLEYKSNYYIF